MQNKEQNRIRAEEARQLLRNPLLKAAFEATREQFVQQLESSRNESPRVRDVLVIGLQVLKNIQGQIETHIKTAQIDAVKVEEY